MRRLFTTRQVAQHCLVSVDGVLKWIKSGKLPAHKTPGGHYRIAGKDFRAFLDDNEIPYDGSMFAEGSPAGHDPENHLLVSCDPVTRQAIRNIVSSVRPGISITGVKPGLETMIRAGSLQPRLIIIQELSVNDPLRMCEALRRSPETCDCRILVLLKKANDGEIRKLYDSGANFCLNRRFTARQLALALESLLMSAESRAAS